MKRSQISIRHRSAFDRVEAPAVSGRKTVVGGFTLVELLTVIAIITILAGLVIGVTGYVMSKATRSRAIADMETIKNALEEYRVTYGQYPTNTVAINSSNWVSALWYKPFHETPSRQPFLVMKGWTDTSVTYRALDPWGNDYRYSNSDDYVYSLWSEGAGTDIYDNITDGSGQ